MKNQKFMVIALVLLITAFGIAKHDVVSPPPGDHNSFNCVTTWSQYSGTLFINTSAVGVLNDGQLSGDLDMDVVEYPGLALFKLEGPNGTLWIQLAYITTGDTSSGTFVMNDGTGDYEGWSITGDFTGITTKAEEGTTWDHFRFLAGQIVKPHEILVPFEGSGKLGFKEGEPFKVLDNDMTDGQAWVQVPAGTFVTYDQARGKPGGDMFWGNNHNRVTKKPVWEKHNDPLVWNVGQSGNWGYTNNGVTCYSFRLYPQP